jgi:acyl-CoA dehydrogenase
VNDALSDAADRLFADTFTPALLRQAARGAHACTSAGSADALLPGRDRRASTTAAWDACEQAGFADALVPEAAGGAGLALPEAWPLAHLAGYYAQPFPFAETLLARAWLHAAGHTVPAGPIGLAPFGAHRQGDSLHAGAVPDAHSCEYVLLQSAEGVWLGARADAHLGVASFAGGAQADMRWALADLQRVQPARHQGADVALSTLAAAATTALMAGAMQRVLDFALAHANQREQFGRPIAKFQAIQQQMSVAAEQVWAARIAGQLAFQACGWAPDALRAAAGKAQTSAAAATVADIAHAVLGAMGITEEYDLGLYSGRLRGWRMAHGTESYWSAQVGQAALASELGALDFIRTKLA